MNELVLLTGISGFLGKHIALEALRCGYRVRGTVRSSGKADDVRRALGAAGADLSRLEFVVADLLRDAGWEDAAAGCRYVLHTASPFPRSVPRGKFALVPIAKGGTLRVIAAARQAGAARIVLTSSTVAVQYGHPPRADGLFTEADVTQVDAPGVSSYAVSKTLAEEAAWAEVAGTPLELCTINPAFVLGSLLDSTTGTSADLIAMMMRGHVPVVPDISFGVVDVRDVARAHVEALSAPEAAGRRFILSADTRSMMEIAGIIGSGMPAYRRRMPRWTLPDGVVRALALVSPMLSQAVPELGARKHFDTAPAETLLGIRFHSADDAILAMGESLLRYGRVG